MCSDPSRPSAVLFTFNESEPRKWLITGVWLGGTYRWRRCIASPLKPLEVTRNVMMGRPVPRHYSGEGYEDGQWHRRIRFKAPVEAAAVLIHKDAPGVVPIRLKVCLGSSSRVTRTCKRDLRIKR